MGHDTRDGMSREEVAEILGITPEAVRQHEKNALQRLRKWAKANKNPLVTKAYIHLRDSING